MTPIGVVRSCWPDRFGIPRQPLLVPSSRATIELDPEVPATALVGLEGFSHVWVIFLFHGVSDTRWTVRPPRLGGNRRRGVLATRSPHRPNHIGMSAVRLLSVAADGRSVEVGGHDLLDGTPVLDLKPYLPYADALPDATSGWAADPIPRIPVRFAPGVEDGIDPGLASVIRETFALDPRPAGRDWPRAAVRIGDRDVHAALDDEGWLVERVIPWEGPTGARS